MREVAASIAEVLDHLGDEEAALEETLSMVRKRVRALTDRFPLYGWKLKPVST